VVQRGIELVTERLGIGTPGRGALRVEQVTDQGAEADPRIVNPLEIDGERLGAHRARSREAAR